MESRQLVIFNINQENFGIEITQIKEIITPMEIFKIPNTPDYIEGLINLRGKVHAVFNLRKRFNLPAGDFDDNTKIIIVNLNSIVVGFIVDEVNEIVRVESGDMENTPQTIISMNRKFINGAARIGDKMILILDLSQVLSIADE